MQYKLAEEDYIHGGTQKSVYSIDEVEYTVCPLCGLNQYKELYKERGAIGIVECSNCSLIYTNPRVKDAEQNYFGNADLFYEEDRLIFSGKKPHHRDKNYVYELTQIKRIKKAGKLLDIGSYAGFFLRKARELGFDSEGVEPSPALAEIGRREFNLTIHNAFFNKKDFSPKSFDVITLIDVFEHVIKPQDMLSHARAVLKDDGILCIKVPNGNYNKLKLSLARATGKESQHDIFNSYEHVVHYSPATMKKMLQKEGFKIKKVIIPLPIDPPIWANLVGHYYSYPSPFILDYKRVVARKIFYWIGKLENALGMQTKFSPDLMFLIQKDNV
jgi:2-polyprenyl-3-methyl-5-hydroxy-6-metoxy-1,4-benzoquinol methylase